MSANYTPEQNEYKDLTPFKSWLLLQINTWGQTNFPFVESDFDELTNYGMMMKFMGCLNDVISNENEVEQDMTNLFGAFTELQNYVNNYFDNLDVQDEINAKLDAMAQDGSLTQLISGYIDPIQNAFESEVRGTLGQMQNQINSVESGSPLVASSTSGMTDTSRVYVNTTDGKWYYYDGDSWEIGGTYQGTGIAENSVEIDSLSESLQFNLKQRIEENNLYNIYDTNNIDLTNNLINANINATTGVIESRSDEIYYATPNYYNIGDKGMIDFPTDLIYFVRGYYYDDDFNYLGYINMTDNLTAHYKIINTFTNAKYVRFRISKRNEETSTISEIIDNIKITINDRKFEMKTTKGNNMFNPYQYFIGYLYGVPSEIFSVVNLPDTLYRTTFPIPVKAGQPYFIKRFRYFMLLDSDLKYIANSVITQNTLNYTFTPAQNGYVLFSYSTEYVESEIMVEGDSEPTFEPYKEYLPPYVVIQNTSNIPDLMEQLDNLSNKTYVALGDSFTHGDFSNSPTNDYYITSGPYNGQYKVYPYIIGTKHNMNIVNLAQNGMTIANIDGTSNNYISDSVLEQIPENCDYITIKIGINDNPDHQNAPLGTINSTNRQTFYGAWNYVMNYLITNYPNAKIGIIISNGMTSIDFINAEINIAKKYGVSYYNETTDEHVPLLIRTMRSDVSSTIKDFRDANWEVNPPTNRHPNAKCHEYESTMIESFLRSL